MKLAITLPNGKRVGAGHFWRKVKKTKSCWLWTGFLTDGYGQLTVNARRVSAHGYSYEIHHGPAPDGLHIDHTCNVRNCVNPDHLEAVTQQENNQRMAARGRHGQSKKTACIHGHEYTVANTYHHPDGYRSCRECGKLRMRELRGGRS